MKVAKLVTVSVTTRVVVDENATDEQIMERALPRLVINLKESGIMDNVEEIIDDEECPHIERCTECSKVISVEDEINGYTLCSECREAYPEEIWKLREDN